MSPHRRKDNPPRREHGENPAESGETGPTEGEPIPGEAESAGATGEYAYDPGAALVDENQYYGAPGEAAYGESSEAYYSPEQVGVEGGYIDPTMSGYGHPAEGGGIPFPPPPVPHQGGGVYDEAPAEEPAPAVPPSPRTKKKVARRTPARHPVAGRGAPRSRVPRPSQRPVYDGGFSVMTVFLSVVAIAMLAAVYLVVRPMDLSQVAGYPVDPIAGGKPRNLLDEAQKAMIDRSAVLVFSEEDVNRYLNHRLAGEQTGPMAALVKFRGVCIDFSPGAAEIIIEREFLGMPMTMSAKLKNEQFRQQIVYKPTGWTLGQISLGSRNVKPVIELFLRLRDTCLDEYHVLQQMREVTFEQDRVALNPVI